MITLKDGLHYHCGCFCFLSCCRAEVARREDVAKRSLFIKILYNGKEVFPNWQPLPEHWFQSALWSDFQSQDSQLSSKHQFAGTVQKRLLSLVNSLRRSFVFSPSPCGCTVCGQVFEELGSSCSLLTQVFVPVPEPSVSTGSVPLEEFEFSSNQRVMFDHEGVGSGKCLHLTPVQMWNTVARKNAFHFSYTLLI